MSALSSGQRVERLRVRLDQPEIKRFWLKTKTRSKSILSDDYSFFLYRPGTSASDKDEGRMTFVGMWE